MKEFELTLLGNQTLGHFFALLFFALFAATLSLLLQATNRDVRSEATPHHFDWQFLVADNWKRCVTTLMLIYVFLRFLPELTGIELNEFYALIVGFTNDKLAQYLKDKTNILGQKK